MCNSPSVRQNKHNGLRYLTPCRRCHGCRTKSVNDYADRVKLEQKHLAHKGYQSSFVRFSYTDQAIVQTTLAAATHNLYHPEDKHYSGTQLKHMQDFTKRLRQHYKRHPSRFVSPDYKYVAASEYAPETKRPHYHVIFLGIPPSEHRTFQSLWPYGFIHTDPLRSGAAQYTLNYIFDARDAKSDADYYHSQNLNPPFYTLSHGLAFDFFLEHFDEIDEYGLISLGSRKIHVPKSFAEKYLPKLLVNYDYVDTILYNAKQLGVSPSVFLSKQRHLNELHKNQQLRKKGASFHPKPAPLDPFNFYLDRRISPPLLSDLGISPEILDRNKLIEELL